MTTPADSNPVNLPDPEVWVDRYGDFLYKYALVRTRNPETAQDLVQDTFLAALSARGRYSGHSSERTWLVGILKHKMIDHFRKSIRERPMSDLELEDDPADSLFDKGGHWIWRTGPARWTYDPRIVAERKEFRAVLDHCLDGLPGRLSKAFVLREIEQLSTDDVCKALEITATNLWVMLHRARARLRRCLEIHWFGKSDERS